MATAIVCGRYLPTFCHYHSKSIGNRGIVVTPKRLFNREIANPLDAIYARCRAAHSAPSTRLHKFESLLNDPQKSVETAFRNTGLELPNPSSLTAQDLSHFLDGNLRHHNISDGEFNARCPNIVADYYRLLCEISEHEIATPQDIRRLDELSHQFDSFQALFYNADVLKKSSLAEHKSSPAWYEDALKNTKVQLEKDKIYREYRYIANTRYLYTQVHTWKK